MYIVVTLAYLTEGYMVRHRLSHDGFESILVSFPSNLYVVADLAFLN